MVKIDRIEHIVTIPEGVTASISEDGVVTIAGPKGSLSREFVSTRIDSVSYTHLTLPTNREV